MNIERNKLKGIVKAMYVGQSMVEVIISIGEMEVVSLISRDSARRMQLKVGDKATAIIEPAGVLVEAG